MTKQITEDISLTYEQIKTIFREAKKGNEQAQFFLYRLRRSDLVVNGETLRDQFARAIEEVNKEEEE